MRRAAISLVLVVGCYTGAPATRDVSAAWQGRTSAELVDRWGAPAARTAEGNLAVLTWTRQFLHVSLPGGGASVDVHPVTVGATGTVPGGTGSVAVQGTAIDASASFHPGEIWHTTSAAAALVDPAGTITRVEGASLLWGPPNDANLHWGLIFGAHVGLGRFDTTPTPLPSGGAYIGGMLGPTLGLVGTFSLVAGTSSSGSGLGLVGGMALQYWPVNRLWLRAGPAALLTTEPGTSFGFHPGVTTAASYAFVKVGRFALDLRLEVNGSTSVALGTLGVGVNVN